LRLEFRDTEIQNFYGVTAALVRLEPNVVGLEIAVDDSLFVSRVDGRTNLLENIERPAHR
jgi:hypothetical protein